MGKKLLDTLRQSQACSLRLGASKSRKEGLDGCRNSIGQKPIHLKHCGTYTVVSGKGSKVSTNAFISDDNSYHVSHD
jgi:hypothetical protein